MVRIEILMNLVQGKVWCPLSWVQLLYFGRGDAAWSEVFSGDRPKPRPIIWMDRTHACDGLSQWRNVYDPKRRWKARIVPSSSPVHLNFR